MSMQAQIQRCSDDDPGPTSDDQAALCRELVRMIPGLRARARFLVRDAAAADDLVHDVLERALSARDRFLVGSNLKAWALRVMRNLVIDAHRRRAPLALPRILTDTTEDRRGEVEILSMDDIKQAMSSLERADRDIFSRAYVEEQSYQQIAEALGMPISTVGTRLWRARNRLRPALAAIYRARLAALGIFSED